ncbi:hypothetical protein [Phytohabitans rumicis]|uniref:Uncharacterized protein n=1 Tax=Phytohabitans rumicis TaxID=1076125 RepID=A0A6V8LJZ6_9ACTN|nr:hypothetical protein [Phytohabitans rumicis]GFJ95198.1 hypothetical protein Prum_088400 [Phytohabitans rumicis]
MLNHQLTGSRYVRLNDVGTPNPGADRPAATTGFLPLLGGAEGTPLASHFIGDESARTGFFAFDSYDVQLICTERTDSSVANAGLAYCAGRGDAMLVAAVPQNFVAGGQAVAYGQTLQGKNVYGALYGPWIIVPDPIGLGGDPRIAIPPVGHVMGVYARIETTRGSGRRPLATRPTCSACSTSSTGSPTRITPTWWSTAASTASGRCLARASSWTPPAR